MALLAALVAGVAIFLFVLGLGANLHQGTQSDIIEARLAQFNASGRVVTNLSEVELSLSFFDRVIRPPLERLANWTARVTPAARQSMLEDRLILAGRPAGLTAASFFVLQLISFVVLAVVGLLLSIWLTASTYGFTLVFVGTLFFAILGYLLPTLILNISVNRRRHELILALPSALDLLTISVEAGLGFDAALTRVTEKYHNALSNEFARVLSEIRLGRPRHEALSDMGARSNVEELNTFIQAVVQSEQLGVGIANVLRIQSEEIRRRRRQRAEEAGQKAPLKMLFPMVFCIFPTLFVVLLGPAIIKVFAEFSH